MSDSPLGRALSDRLHDAVDAHFELHQVPLLERLVNTSSHSYAPEDVEAASSILDEEAAAIGLSVTRHTSSDTRFGDPRVYETPGLDKETPSIALVGHIDTVFPRSSGFVRFSRAGDIARGPGVVDMKSGLTIILFGLRALRTASPELADALKARFICVTDEEVGTPSGRRIYDALAPVLTEALVFEMGREGDRIVTSRKGGGTFTVQVRGVGAHSGNAHGEGVSAIHALSLLIPQIEAMTDYERGVTLNVGLFEGGTAKNTVPATARCVIDLRCVTGLDAKVAMRQLKELVAHPFDALPNVPERLRSATFELTGSIGRPPMEAVEAIQALRLRYERYAAQVGFGVGEAPRQGGFSDSNLLAPLGVPTIDGLGGSGGGAHSNDEWCSLDSVRRRTQALALYLAEVAGTP